MSASRPKPAKIIQKPLSTSDLAESTTTNGIHLKTIAAQKAGSPAISGAKAERQAKIAKPPRPTPRPPIPIDVAKYKLFGRATPPPGVQRLANRLKSEEEEDEFEEVPIPSVAGPSSPFPGTPNTGGNLTRGTTPGTVTTAPSVDDNYDGYQDEASGEEDQPGGDGIIRLEIGGETPEDRAKRIALALRKYARNCTQTSYA